MPPSNPSPIPPAVIAAARRVVAPARVLRAVAGGLAVAAAAGATLLWLALVLSLDGFSFVGVGGSLLALAVLLVPAWWLRRARGTFGDLADLPGRLQSLRDQGPRFTVTKADLTPSELRAGGLGNAIRTIRTTVREVGDLLGPAATVAEVAAPPFWVWTAAASAAAVVLALVGAIGVLVVALT